MTGSASARHAHLRAAGSSLLLRLDDLGRLLPLHWGRDLGPLTDSEVDSIDAALRHQRIHSSVDEPRAVGLVPQTETAYGGRPGVLGHHADGGTSPCFRQWALTATPDRLVATSVDSEAGLRLTCQVRITAQGVLLLDYTLANIGSSRFTVEAVQASLPIPARANEILDLSGRWCRERIPQRHRLQQGVWLRESRRGRTGHDATLLLVAGVPGFRFGHGEVWGLHVAWSGDHVSYVEATPEGDSRLGGGELLHPGEVVLAPGEDYSAPTVVAVWSDEGLDGLSAALHGYVRELPHLRSRPRRVVLNTWEAVYFDHDLPRLHRLAELAADVGVERFVLDDGWFRGRTDDTRGLGDWVVDPDRWPDGLHPLIDRVHALGMDFGLWVEPEMVNLDSDLARAHPGWVLRGRAEEPPPSWRHQQVLDLQNEAAYRHVRDALLALLEDYPVAFLKWDHNRDLLDVRHGGRPAVHGQTSATYRLLEELTARHPDLEIETCASGGGRVDLGILGRTHRVWASDTNDPVERSAIQRWTGLLVPPELIGAHVGATVAHTTGRSLPLAFRAAATVLESCGLEWDLLQTSQEERTSLRAWIALHKQARETVAAGRTVRTDHPDRGLVVTTLVAADASEAWCRLAQVASATTSQPSPVLIPGLDPARDYRIERVDPPGPEPLVALEPHSIDTRPLTMPGAALRSVGLRPPVLAPGMVRVLRLQALPRAGQ